MKNAIVFFFVIFYCSILTSKEYCSFKDILNLRKKVSCNNGNLIFGNFEFSSKYRNFEYDKIDDLKIKVLKKFKKEILSYINKNCDKKNIKIKEITNYVDFREDFSTKVIISCNIRNE
ncbi:MAG: hypothetical protein CMP42_00850 [Rickettsiales bacterium]|nr:hypothetical protein [Rickettsiales bacterium]